MIGSPLSQGGWVQPYDENDTGIGRGFFALCWAVYQGERVNAFSREIKIHVYAKRQT